MKIFYSIILILIFHFNSLGQHYSPPMTIQTPDGPVKTQGYWYGAPNHYYGDGAEIVSRQYTFTVQTTSDSIFRAKGEIDWGDSIDCLVIGNRKKTVKIYPTQTKGIVRITNDGRALKGVAADSCWLFKTSSGAINVYSFLAEENYCQAAIAFQKGKDGEITRLSMENLQKAIVNPDEKMQKLIEDDRLIKAIKRYNKKEKSKK